jgi:hypothetical protein
MCPICHCKDKPWHVPQNCPLFKELNLKLDIIPLGPAAKPAAQQSTDAPSPSPPSHGGRALGVDDCLPGGSSGSGHAPSGLLASMSGTLPPVLKYDLDDNF